MPKLSAGFVLFIAAWLLSPAWALEQPISQKLENGLTLMVWPNQAVENPDAVSIELLVKAGSLQETDEQQGFAHLVEHLAFRELEGYGDGELLKALKDLGVELGKHSNAFTTFDQTRYHLRLRDADDAKIGRSLDIVKAWAQGLIFDADSVAKEIDIVLEERRLQDDAQDDVGSQLLLTRSLGSLRAKRIPIGQKQTLIAATPEALTAFYKRWYQPNNMVLIASGNIDGKRFIDMAKARLAELEGQSPEPIPSEIIPAKIPNYQHFSNQKQILPLLLAEVYIKDKPSTAAQFKKQQRLRLWLSFLAKKLSEVTTESQGKINQLNLSIGEPSPEYYSLGMIGAPGSGNYQDVADALVEAFRRSFSQLDQAALDAEIDARIGQLAIDDSSAAYLSQEMANMAMYDEVAYEDKGYLSQTKAAYKALRVEDLAHEVRGLFTGQSWRVFSASTQEENHAKLAARLADALAQAAETEVNTEALSLPVLDQALAVIETPPLKLEAGDLGLHRYRLDNGIELNILPVAETQFGQLSWHLTTQGGHLSAPLQENFAAMLVFELAMQSGLRGLNANQLEQYIYGEQLEFAPIMGQNLHAIAGEGAALNLDKQLRLLRIFLEEAAINAAALQRFKTIKSEEVIQYQNSPFFEYSALTAKQGYADHPLARVIRLEELEALELAPLNALLRAYAQAFAQSTLVISGDIKDLEAIAAVVNRVVGAMQLDNQPRPAAAQYPYSQKRGRTVAASGNPEPRTELARECLVEAGMTWMDPNIEILTSVLEQRISKSLREDLALVYNVDVQSLGAFAGQRYTDFTIKLSTAAENEEKAREALDLAIEDFVATGPSEAEIDQEFQSLRTDREGLRRNHRAMTALLSNALMLGTGIDELLEPSQLEKPDAPTLAAMIKPWLKKQSCIDFVFRP